MDLSKYAPVLALAVGAVGSMGKLYAEAIEAIDPQQVLAVRATGANRLLAFIYGVIPQALPLIASYSLLLFEGNIRHASILGLVGAGGIGFILGKYMALFQYSRLMGAVILLVVTVTIIDRFSDYLRKKII
jgi:phosphonate transport system permease protein